MELQTVHPVTAAARVSRQLRAEILSGALPIGHRIAGEGELMARFSVSRQTVREALRELGAEGLIRSRRGAGGGAFVAAPDLTRVTALMSGAGAMMSAADSFPYDQVSEAIFEIEAACCRLAARRRSAEAVRAMRAAIAHASTTCDDGHVFFDAQIAFNRALWSAAGNRALEFVMAAFMQAMRRTVPAEMAADQVKEIRTFLHRNHSAICDAVDRGDGEAAVAHLEENFRFWLEQFSR